MTEPASSEPWKGSIEHPIRIGENQNANGSLLSHTLRHLRLRQLVALIVSRARRATEQSGQFFRRSVPVAPDCRWEPRDEFLATGPQNNAAGDLLGGLLMLLMLSSFVLAARGWLRRRGLARLKRRYEEREEAAIRE